jgi:hypothetical protein
VHQLFENLSRPLIQLTTSLKHRLRRIILSTIQNAKTTIPTTIRKIPQRVLVTSGDEGNFGKSTLARHLLAPALAHHFAGGVRFLAVEDSGRLSAGEDARFKSTDVVGIVEELSMLEDDEAVIVEIGAQRFERFMSELKRLPVGKFAFDKCVFPVGQTIKAEETLKSILRLIEAGIEAKDIHVIFNRVELMAISEGTWEDSLNSVYRPFMNSMKKIGIRVCMTPLMNSDVIEALRYMEGKDFTLIALAAAEKDVYLNLAKQARKAGDKEKMRVMLDLHSVKLQAEGLLADLQIIFAFVFPEFKTIKAAEEK